MLLCSYILLYLKWSSIVQGSCFCNNRDITYGNCNIYLDYCFKAKQKMIFYFFIIALKKHFNCLGNHDLHLRQFHAFCLCELQRWHGVFRHWGYCSKDFASKHKTPFCNSFRVDITGSCKKIIQTESSTHVIWSDQQCDSNWKENNTDKKEDWEHSSCS